MTKRQLAKAEQYTKERLWRQGNKVKQNVYAGSTPVCMCQTSEQAELIVKAVNDYITLSDPTCGHGNYEGYCAKCSGEE